MARIRRSTTTRDRARDRARRRAENCHICGQPIDYNLPWDDPRALVIDHVHPLARGGEDALSNMRAAHRHTTGSTQPSWPRRRDCNSKKRARIVAPIIRRSGALN